MSPTRHHIFPTNRRTIVSGIPSHVSACGEEIRASVRFTDKPVHFGPVPEELADTTCEVCMDLLRSNTGG